MVRDHFQLVKQGLAVHETRDYEKALSIFEEALKRRSACPNALYNKANVLHMLGRDGEALKILLELIDSNDLAYLEGCPEMVETPRSLRLDALFLSFLCMLDQTGSWKAASPYLRRHLASRARGLRSLWSRSQIVAEAEELRLQYAPRAKSVKAY